MAEGPVKKKAVPGKQMTKLPVKYRAQEASVQNGWGAQE
jgi:hypothetical protein